jgi:ATP-dependent Lhr-like helicase
VARVLLERFGVVARETIDAEILPVEWSDLYKVLRAMEEAGRVRRGWFVAGRTASQFAAPGADDRLRALRETRETGGARDARDDAPEEALVLAATDPANAWGAALPWPDREGARPQRSAGSLVFLHEGALVGWLGRTERTLLTFLPADEPTRARSMDALASALAELVDRGGDDDGDDHDGLPGRRALLLETIDGAPAATSALAPALRAHGFVARVAGLQRRRGDVAPAQPRSTRLRG